MELNPRVKGSLDANHYKLIMCQSCRPAILFFLFFKLVVKEKVKNQDAHFLNVRGTAHLGTKCISHVHLPLTERLRWEARD